MVIDIFSINFVLHFFQVLFIKWVLTVFDMIDAKDNLRAIYGVVFSFVTEENLVSVFTALLYASYLVIHDLRWKKDSLYP